MMYFIFKYTNFERVKEWKKTTCYSNRWRHPLTNCTYLEVCWSWKFIVNNMQFICTPFFHFNFHNFIKLQVRGLRMTTGFSLPIFLLVVNSSSSEWIRQRHFTIKNIWTALFHIPTTTKFYTKFFLKSFLQKKCNSVKKVHIMKKWGYRLNRWTKYEIGSQLLGKSSSQVENFILSNS